MRTFSVGDVIRKARKAKHWNQARLGKEAARFVLHHDQGPINVSTVVDVEADPYVRKVGTVWRLLAALGLTWADVEREIPSPFTELAKSSLSADERDKVQRIEQLYRQTTSKGPKKHAKKRGGKHVA